MFKVCIESQDPKNPPSLSTIIIPHHHPQSTAPEDQEKTQRKPKEETQGGNQTIHKQT